MKDIKRAGFAIAMGLSALLAGCGGGGGGSSSSSTANQSSLSADQQAFEQFALAPNAVYNLSWLLPLSGTPAPSTQYFVESHASMAASPSTAGTQALNGSTPTSIANTLSVPSTASVSRYVINGAIVVGSGSQDSVSYQGTGVKVNALAADGVTVVDSVIRSGFSVVPLSGAVASAPTDLAHWLNSLYFNSALLSTTATWNSGAAYVKYTSTEVADTYTVVDYDSTATATATSTTTGNTPDPVPGGTTIAGLMANGGIFLVDDNTTYTLSNGSVSSINGVTTYVASAVRPNLTTPTYRTFYELNGNVYVGSLVKAGTVIGGNAYPVAVSGGGSTPNYSEQYQIRFNAAAVASLHAAVTF